MFIAIVKAAEDTRFVARLLQLSLLLALLVCADTARAALDLRNATVAELRNGLVVILLEDDNFPLVSVQMLYRVGARNETAGRTGLAHFLEHMAFRASENFPDTGLVSSIYAVGGEWHGYTWLDQTTYFATVPKEQLDLLLRIEADRMQRLELAAGDMDAERGAVLAEMHMYENSPTSMLLDAVMFSAFQAHPYRSNTIGWESDIEQLPHAAVVDFYERHYHPANAVLAIVGDFDSEVVLSRIDELFAEFPAKPATPLPHTLEPQQHGERRAVLYGAGDGRQFMIAYRAPSVHSPDYPAFVVLQQILGASSGVSFLQNDWGTPVKQGSVLAGAAASLTTWYPPSEQEFLFVIGGSAAAKVDESRVEEQIEKRIASLRRRGPSVRMLTAAVKNVLGELAFDVESTEDAAHQLAFFEGLHALDVLLALPDRIATVTTADVQRVAQTYLQPGLRTIAWRVPRPPAERVSLVQAVAPELDRGGLTVAPVDRVPVQEPILRTLRGGVPVMVQASDLSPNVQLRIVLPGNLITAESLSPDDPVTGYSSMTYTFNKEKLAAAVAGAAEDLAKASLDRRTPPVPSTDPANRMEQVFGEFMGGTRQSDSRRPALALIAVSGDVDVNETSGLLERYFGSFEPASLQPATPTDAGAVTLIVKLGRPVAQAQLGYIVEAPGPGDARADAYRLLLYILSHDYEGRLGKKAISERGLAYYIDSRYRSDGLHGWVTLSVGVDPGKIAPLRALLAAELNRLLAEPPTAAEIDDAKNHLVGRARSAAQTNDELTSELARQWLWYGERMSADALALRLAQVRRQDILDVVGEFVAGTTIVVQE